MASWVIGDPNLGALGTALIGTDAGHLRVTEIMVSAGQSASTPASIRITEVKVTTGYMAAVAGTIRLTEVKVVAGPASQEPVAALPSVYYLGDDGNAHPYQLLTTADLPWP